jgi:tRNA-2-methylthio-N6-dimethylallyladenosine synthase
MPKLSMDLNLPIQSGDDEVLKKMNRPYTVSQYKALVKKIRKALPNIRLSTDIIVGFPGETKTQFITR